MKDNDFDVIKEMIDRIELSEDQRKVLREFRKELDAKMKAAEPIAKAMGMSPEEFIAMNEIPKAHMTFLRAKSEELAAKYGPEHSFDVDTLPGLQKALHWLKTTDADNLFYGDPKGDPLDIKVGEMRRDMLIQVVSQEIKKKSQQ